MSRRARSLVERGRRRLGVFSWDTTVEGLVAIYRRAMETSDGERVMEAR